VLLQSPCFLCRYLVLVALGYRIKPRWGMNAEKIRNGWARWLALHSIEPRTDGTYCLFRDCLFFVPSCACRLRCSASSRSSHYNPCRGVFVWIRASFSHFHIPTSCPDAYNDYCSQEQSAVHSHPITLGNGMFFDLFVFASASSKSLSGSVSISNCKVNRLRSR
jgi:hypothetical protein